VKRLFEIADSGEECVIVGTLFKKQELKPSILQEISEEVGKRIPAPYAVLWPVNKIFIITEYMHVLSGG
jgi:hypothetical protein